MLSTLVRANILRGDGGRTCLAVPSAQQTSSRAMPRSTTGRNIVKEDGDCDRYDRGPDIRKVKEGEKKKRTATSNVKKCESKSKLVSALQGASWLQCTGDAHITALIVAGPN